MVELADPPSVIAGNYGNRQLLQTFIHVVCHLETEMHKPACYMSTILDLELSILDVIF